MRYVYLETIGRDETGVGGFVGFLDFRSGGGMVVVVGFRRDGRCRVGIEGWADGRVLV